MESTSEFCPWNADQLMDQHIINKDDCTTTCYDPILKSSHQLKPRNLQTSTLILEATL